MWPLASYLTLGCACCLMEKETRKKILQTLALNQINLVLSFVILLWNVKVLPLRPTSFIAPKPQFQKPLSTTQRGKSSLRLQVKMLLPCCNKHVLVLPPTHCLSGLVLFQCPLAIVMAMFCSSSCPAHRPHLDNALL